MCGVVADRSEVDDVLSGGMLAWSGHWRGGGMARGVVAHGSGRA